jgi:hypothetical protein
MRARTTSDMARAILPLVRSCRRLTWDLFTGVAINWTSLSTSWDRCCLPIVSHAEDSAYRWSSNRLFWQVGLITPAM